MQSYRESCPQLSQSVNMNLNPRPIEARGLVSFFPELYLFLKKNFPQLFCRLVFLCPIVKKRLLFQASTLNTAAGVLLFCRESEPPRRFHIRSALWSYGKWRDHVRPVFGGFNPICYFVSVEVCL